MNQAKSHTTLPCDIVRDLLPLYHDEVVSDATRQSVSAHLDGCPPCRAEYDALCAALPAEGPEEDSTQSKFSGMMKKIKRKRIIVTTLVALIACGLLVGLIAFLYEVPLVDIPLEDAEIPVVCRYETDGTYKFFVIYSVPANTGFSHGKFSTAKDDPSALEISYKKTLFARDVDTFRNTGTWIIEASNANGAPYTTLCFNDQVIWTEEANGDDPVPDYVYACDESHESNQIPMSFVDLEEGYLGLIYEDGHRMVWSLDGKLLAADYPDAQGNYPDLP